MGIQKGDRGALLGAGLTVGAIALVSITWVVVDARDEAKDDEISEYRDVYIDEPAEPEGSDVIELLDAMAGSDIWEPVCDAYDGAAATGLSLSELKRIAIDSFEDGFGDELTTEEGDHLWELIQNEC